MSSYAYLVINYDKRTIETDPKEYVIKATVDTQESRPDAVDTALLVKRGNSGTDETIQGVVDFLDLDAPNIGVLPLLVDQFETSESLSHNDIITVYTPDWWQEYFTAATTIDVTVQEDGVTVDPPLPAFARQLDFKINGSSTTYSDGVANRNYADYPPGTFIYFRASEGYALFYEIVNATNKETAINTEAQKLVDDLNQDNFTGTEQEIFE